jgi:hypothetical protein
MTVARIIKEIKGLPPKDQAAVIRFAYRLDAKRRLSGGELSVLAERLSRTTDLSEAMRLREAILHGFYGSKLHA